MVNCKNEREHKDDLELQLRELEQDLANAPPQEKPGIIDRIQELFPRVDDAVIAYEDCMLIAPTDFNP